MTDRKIKFYITDVFGVGKYSGNQLATFPNASELTSTEMQQIAREVNFSETTFVIANDVSKKEFSVRIFTPENEVPFAGHPTLGTAKIIFDKFLDASETELTLTVKAGKIPVKRIQNTLWMHQIQPQFGPIFDKDVLARILNIYETNILSHFPIQQVSTGLPFILIPLKNLEALKKATVTKQLARELLKDSPVKEFMIFCLEGYSTEDKISTRVFVEEFGIPEDPATGSATGCLAAYLLQYNVLGSNSIELSVAQGYEINRPSRLFIKASRTAKKFDISIGGRVNYIAEGNWY
jgi:trans-2,3-dihydro-3-hydroxyanthranilate isomerase